MSERMNECINQSINQFIKHHFQFSTIARKLVEDNLHLFYTNIIGAPWMTNWSVLVVLVHNSMFINV